MRSKLSGDIRTLLTTQLENYNVVVIDASIEDLDFSDTFTDAVEAKQVAEQKSKQAKIEQEQKNMEAEAAAERAKIEAEAEAAVAKIAAEAELEVVKIQADAAEYAGQKDAAIIGQVREPILPEDNIGTLYDRLMQIGATLVLDSVNRLAAGEVRPVEQPQSDENLRPAPKIFKEDCLVDWSRCGADIVNFVRGLSPYPAAWSRLSRNGEECGSAKIFEVRFEPKANAGEVGRVVGAKMSAVSQFHQVIAITHLPQSAVYADRHLVVSKSVSGGRTRTQVREACGTERVAEIARMLGGEKLTSVVIKHAEELLEYGKEKRR
jgi:hypothetical protein